MISLREEPTAEGSHSIKRRRQGSSDERKPKRARKGSNEKSGRSPLVFLCLGGPSAEEENLMVPHSAQVAAVTPLHSARVAATVPVHSVQQIALTSGSKRKEGLMDNSNPLRSI